MKVLIAPDSMKECLSALSVSESIAKGVVNTIPDAKVICIPLADGGEGTVEVLVNATKGRIINTTSHDPIMRIIGSFYGILGDEITAVIEVASTSGLQLLKMDERNPLVTSSYGTGELILHALNNGCRNFILGLGGSATNDGGAGILCALGAQLKDDKGELLLHGGGFLNRLHSIDISEIDQRIFECTFLLACDVENKLLGPSGASYVFGPQKGATPSMLEKLDSGLNKFSEVLSQLTKKELATIPGTGAAGGMAVSFLAFFKTELQSGFSIVAEYTNLKSELENVDLIFTAEGKTDAQTLKGKVPLGVARLAKQFDKPLYVLTGIVEEDAYELYNHGVTSIISIADESLTLEESIVNASSLLEKAAENALRLFLK